jgi:uncharacterized membrane protein YqjE
VVAEEELLIMVQQEQVELVVVEMEENKLPSFEVHLERQIQAEVLVETGLLDLMLLVAVELLF